ncbi:26S proteasome non-ATPase regulatory subunit 5-like [Clytia hemisphaerica]|uniref:26S proteasome non-ATPase regulatory subunit 5-like n=1 Tax=Clytia hemisphaerica TaxID=252671 RepID=UPI0034D79F17
MVAERDIIMAGENVSLENLLEEFNFNATRDTSKFVSALENLLTLATSSEEKLKWIAAGIDVNILFNELGDSGEDSILKQPQNKSVLADLCKLLGLILSTISPVNVFTQYVSHIVKSFDAGIEEYLAECLHQTMRLAQTGNIGMFMSNPEIFVFIVKGLGFKSLSVASSSRKVIVKLFECTEQTEWLFSSEVYGVCRNLMEKDATVRFRVYEIFLELLKLQPEDFFKFAELGSFDCLFTDLMDSGDVLSQLNALEHITQLALTGIQGLEFVEQRGIMSWLQNTFSSGDPFAQFLLPGAIKCFGVLCASNPTKIISKYQNLLTFIYENLSSPDTSIRCLCVETLAFISSRSDALKELYKHPDSLKESTEKIGQMVASHAEDEQTKSKILVAVATMFLHDPADVELSMICEKLFHHLSSEPVRFLMDLAKQPFLAIRYGALKLFCNVSKFSWVEQDMALCAGFLEYLLDRKTESEKEGRELKYHVVKNLAISNTAGENLGMGFHNKILAYAKEGPFYSEGQVAVTYQREN